MNGGLRVHSSYIIQPKDQMSVFKLYGVSDTSSCIVAKRSKSQHRPGITALQESAKQPSVTGERSDGQKGRRGSRRECRVVCLIGKGEGGQQLTGDIYRGVPTYVIAN